jgi:hypothetical protein
MLINGQPACREQELGRPHVVVKGASGSHIVVLRHKPVQTKPIDPPSNVSSVLLELELWRMNSDDHETVIAVLVVPAPKPGNRPDAVDAGVGPEIIRTTLSFAASFAIVVGSPFSQFSIPVIVSVGRSAPGCL